MFQLFSSRRLVVVCLIAVACGGGDDATVASGLDQGMTVYIWGAQHANGFVYASDMLNGIWKLKAVR
jgi:hypothetical protein